MQLFSHAGKKFASVAAAKAFHQMGKYFADEPPRTKRKTMTKYSGSLNYSHNENLPAGVSASKLKMYVNPPLKGMLKGSIEYRDYYNYEFSWFAGTKKYAYICGLGCASQWTDSNFLQNMASESNQAWFDLSANQGQVAGGFVPAATRPASQKMGLSAATIKYDLINLSSLPCKLTFTWYRCKTDSNKDPLDFYKDSVNAHKLLTTDFTYDSSNCSLPTVAGNETILQTIGPNGNDFHQIVTMPYIQFSSRKDVAQTWGRLKSKTITLAPADIHNLSQYINLNIFQKKNIVEANDKPLYPKGMVMCVMEMQGLATHLVIPAAEGQPAVNEPSLGAGRVGIVISRHLHLKSLKCPEEKNDVTYIGRGSVPVLGSVAQSSTINTNLSVQVGAETT